MVATKAHQRLAACAAKIGQVALARRLGASQQAVSKWSKGLSFPNATWREVIRIALDIPINAWWTADDLALFEDAKNRRIKRRRVVGQPDVLAIDFVSPSSDPAPEQDGTRLDPSWDGEPGGDEWMGVEGAQNVTAPACTEAAIRTRK